MISCERFRKNEHILKTKDFAHVYKKGRQFKKDSLILYVLPNTFGYNRIGFSIGSRNIKLSTRRNRIRRLLREAFRRRKNELRRGHDLVFIAKKDLGARVFYKDIELVFLKLMKESGLLQEWNLTQLDSDGSIRNCMRRGVWKKLWYGFWDFIVTICRHGSYNVAGFTLPAPNTLSRQLRNTAHFMACGKVWKEFFAVIRYPRADTIP